jgi:hypothetical protein
LGIPIRPSPFRSCWKVVSADFSTELDPDIAGMNETKLPPLSVVHSVYRSAPFAFQTTW